MRVFKIVLRKTFFKNIFSNVEKYSAPMSAKGRDHERQGRDNERHGGDHERQGRDEERHGRDHERQGRDLSLIHI